MRHLIMRIAVLLVAICRTVYCWMFLYWSVTALYVAYTNIQHPAYSPFTETWYYTYMIMGLYSIILGVAWWMIFRGKPASKRWAIAANLVFILNYVPGLLFGHWRDVLKAELEWWPVIALVGIFGIIIFSIPYHGWRQGSARGGPGLDQAADVSQDAR